MILIPILIGLLAFVLVDTRRTRGVRPEASMQVRGGSGAVVRALARVEAVRLLTSPWFLMGIVLTGIGVYATGIGSFTSLSRVAPLQTLFMFPLAGMVLIAVNVNVLRSRRDGIDELFDTTPVSLEARFLGHVAALAPIFVIAALLSAGHIVYLRLSGHFGFPDPIDLLTGPLLVVCAGVVGASAARLIPSAAGGLIAVFLMGILQGVTDHFAGLGEKTANWFSFVVTDPELWPVDLLARRPLPHLFYLAALGAFAACLGLMRHRRDRVVVIALIASIAVASGAGVVQAWPRPEGEWKRIAASIADPESFQACRTHEAVRYCAYRGYEPLIEHWRKPVEGVLRALPGGVRVPAFSIQQLPQATGLWRLPPEVRRYITTPAVPREYPELWPQGDALQTNGAWCRNGGSCDLALGLITAGRIVGLPTRAAGVTGPMSQDLYEDVPLGRYAAGGQARAVIALWLAGQSTPAAKAHMTQRSGAPAEPKQSIETVAIEGCEGTFETGTTFDTADVLTAVELLARPDAEVRRLLARDWKRLTDPATPASVLRDAFGLPPAQSPSGFFANC